MNPTDHKLERTARATLASWNRLTLLCEELSAVQPLYDRLVSLEAGLPELARLSDGERQALALIMAEARALAVAVARHGGVLVTVRDREAVATKRAIEQGGAGQ